MEKEFYYFLPPSLLSARTAQLGLVSCAARFPRVACSLSPQRPSMPAKQRRPRSPLSLRVSLTSRSRLSAASSPSSSSCPARTLLRRRRKSTAATPRPCLAPQAAPGHKYRVPRPCLPIPSFEAASPRRQATLALAAAAELNPPKSRAASICSAPW